MKRQWMTRRLGPLAILLGLAGGMAQGAEQMLEDFSGAPEARWSFISDQVMGGVSNGTVAFEQVDGLPALRLRGDVSTKNNGGFIQARLMLPEALPEGAEGLELRVRGNGQGYFVHVRTGGTVLPWNFYQAPFEAGDDWSVVRIPFSAFKAQGMLLRKSLAAGAVKSIAVVAYGRDYAADVMVSAIKSY